MKKSTSNWICQILGPLNVKRQINEARKFQELEGKMTPTIQTTV